MRYVREFLSCRHAPRTRSAQCRFRAGLTAWGRNVLVGLTLILLQSEAAGQSLRPTWLPLAIVANSSEFLDLTESGYEFNVQLEFRVSEDDFFDAPDFCIYIQKPEGDIERIAVDSTMLWSKCETCLGVSFNVMVQTPGWMGCYCFPTGFEMYPLSLEQLNRSTVQRQVYLRYQVW